MTIEKLNSRAIELGLKVKAVRHAGSALWMVFIRDHRVNSAMSYEWAQAWLTDKIAAHLASSDDFIIHA